MLVNPRQSVATYTMYHLEIVKMDEFSKREDVIHSIQNEVFHFCNDFIWILFYMNTIARFQLGLLSPSPFPSDGDVDGDRCGWRLDRSG